MAADAHLRLLGLVQSRLVEPVVRFSVQRAAKAVEELADSGRLEDVENPRYSNKGFLSCYRTHLDPEYGVRATEMERGRRIAA